MSSDIQAHAEVQLWIDHVRLTKTATELNSFSAELDSQVNCLKSSVFKCCDDIFIINILVMSVEFVFKI